MAVHYRTQGFILNKEDLREADQVFSIYTQDYGRLKVLARAIRKIKSKLRSGAELFYLSEIEFIQGRNYKTLTDALTLEKFKGIRGDLEKLNIAEQIAETADNLIRGQEKDEEIFNLLNETFNKLNNYKLQITNYKLLYYYFLWNLLSVLGYKIDLYRCALCRSKLIPQNLYFNPEQGIICFNCFQKGNEISSDVIKILRLFLKKDWNILLRLKTSERHKKELELISDSYLACIND